MESKYRFVKDDDCHWYLIPYELYGSFVFLLRTGEKDCWAEFNNRFEEFRCDSPCHYVFESPKDVYQ